MSDVIRLSKKQKQLLFEFRNLCMREAQDTKTDLNGYYGDLNTNQLLLLALSFAVERKRFTMRNYIR